jgi:hypothetical protein
MTKSVAVRNSTALLHSRSRKRKSATSSIFNIGSENKRIALLNPRNNRPYACGVATCGCSIYIDLGAKSAQDESAICSYTCGKSTANAVLKLSTINSLIQPGRNLTQWCAQTADHSGSHHMGPNHLGRVAHTVQSPLFTKRHCTLLVLKIDLMTTFILPCSVPLAKPSQ